MSPVLYDAIIHGRFRQVQYLINSGVPIDGPNSQCALDAALHIPNGRTRDRFFRFLLSCGANYNCVDRETGRNVFATACKLERVKELKTLLSFAPGDIDMNARDAYGYTALHHAVSTGSVSLVQLIVTNLMRYGLSADVTSHGGLTPYQYAQRFGFYNIADILRQEGFASVHRLSIVGTLPRIAEETTRRVGKDVLRSSIAGGRSLHHGGFVCQRQQQLATAAKQTRDDKHPPNRPRHPRFVGLSKRQTQLTNPVTTSLDSGLQAVIKFHSEPNAYGRISSDALRRISRMNRQHRDVDLPSIIDVVSLEMSPSYRAPAEHIVPIIRDSRVQKKQSVVLERLASNASNLNIAVPALSAPKRTSSSGLSEAHGRESPTRHPSAMVQAAVETFKRNIASPMPRKGDS